MNKGSLWNSTKCFIKRNQRACFLATGFLVLMTTGLFVILGLGGEKGAAESAAASVPTEEAGAQASASLEAEQESEGESATVTVPQNAEGYAVIGVLTIDKLAFQMPVIGEVSDAALEVSPCLYSGPPSPEYAGNIVITGHNYRNDSHFGRLDELEVGDVVRLSDKAGYEYSYEVYETKTIGPNDVDAFDDYEGEYGLSLVTCANNGENRLLVRCRQTE